MGDRDRPAGFAQVFNLRDLGGLPSSTGGRVRPGRLFRSDSPHRATAEDVARLQSLGLQLVIDLRQATEREHFGVAAAEVATRHHHLPVFDVSSGGGGRPLTGTVEEGMAAAARREGQAGEYLFMLEYGWATFVGAIEALAEPDHLPALFHCAVGRDRTGVLAALVLSLLDVPADVVVADYARSHDGLVSLVEWAVTNEPDYGDDLRRGDPSPAPWARAEVMARFLQLVAEHHGSVRGFLADAGLPADVPARLRDLLLEVPA